MEPDVCGAAVRGVRGPAHRQRLVHQPMVAGRIVAELFAGVAQEAVPAGKPAAVVLPARLERVHRAVFHVRRGTAARV